jgi:hypothetical protein
VAAARAGVETVASDVARQGHLYVRELQHGQPEPIEEELYPGELPKLARPKTVEELMNYPDGAKDSSLRAPARHASHRPDLDPISAAPPANPAPTDSRPPADDPDSDPEAVFWAALRARALALSHIDTPAVIELDLEASRVVMTRTSPKCWAQRLATIVRLRRNAEVAWKSGKYAHRSGLVAQSMQTWLSAKP